MADIMSNVHDHARTAHPMFSEKGDSLRTAPFAPQNPLARQKISLRSREPRTGNNTLINNIAIDCISCETVLTFLYTET